MSEIAIIRAWKHYGQREKRNDYEQSDLPEHPAGDIELLDTDLAELKGGTTAPVASWFMTSCQMVTACRSRDDEAWR
jgi:mersacidin/lichenicidin family type 2 lantibiotic